MLAVTRGVRVPRRCRRAGRFSICPRACRRRGSRAPPARGLARAVTDADTLCGRARRRQASTPRSAAAKHRLFDRVLDRWRRDVGSAPGQAAGGCPGRLEVFGTHTDYAGGRHARRAPCRAASRSSRRRAAIASSASSMPPTPVRTTSDHLPRPADASVSRLAALRRGGRGAAGAQLPRQRRSAPTSCSPATCRGPPA